MVGAQPPARRDDALAHAGGVDRERRRLLEDARAGRFRGSGKTERIVQRMDVKRLRRVDGVEIVVALEHVAHALDRPAFDLPAEVLADQADGGEVVVGVVRLRDLEPALLDRIDARHTGFADRACAHIRGRPRRAPTAPWRRRGPTRLTTASMPQAKPGSTKPVLRPDAFQATSCASITTTDQPRRATSRAVVSPARPAPITQTSTSMSLVTGPRSGAATIVSVYQVDCRRRPARGTHAIDPADRGRPRTRHEPC